MDLTITEQVRLGRQTRTSSDLASTAVPSLIVAPSRASRSPKLQIQRDERDHLRDGDSSSDPVLELLKQGQSVQTGYHSSTTRCRLTIAFAPDHSQSSCLSYSSNSSMAPTALTRPMVAGSVSAPANPLVMATTVTL